MLLPGYVLTLDMIFGPRAETPSMWYNASHEALVCGYD